MSLFGIRQISILKQFLLTVIIFILTTSFSYAETETKYAPELQAFITRLVKVHGFKEEDLKDLFKEVKINPQVMHSMNHPLENETWNMYQMLFVNEWRIQHGVEFWQKNEQTLADAEKQYGVPANIIVATLGIETKYGQRLGDYRVIDSLSSLAFSDHPRAKFFKGELEQFLLLTREQDLEPLKVMGSYAGALGQPQFLPSSYRHYAVNFSKSGKIDLMNNTVDAIGSIANYYQKHGWEKDAPIVSKVEADTKQMDELFKNRKLPYSATLKEWQKFNIATEDKMSEKINARLIVLEKLVSKEYWFGFHNFEVIKRYNSSDQYAMAVYQLGLYISKLRDRLHHG